MTKRKMTTKAIISTAVLALGISLMPTGNAFTNTDFGVIQAEASTAKYKTTDNLNMRTGGSVKHKILTTIPKGKEVTYVGKSGTWFKVKYGSKTGYVSSKYLTKVTAPKVTAKAPVKAPVTPKASVVTYVTTDNLNLRTGASTKYKVLTLIPKGKSVTYLAKSGTWYKVKYGSHTGYVSSAYLKKPGTTSAVTTVKYPAPSTKTPGTYVGGILIVNKKYSLPSNYNPGISATAQKAVNAMVADAKKQGVYVSTISSYRSYSYQAGLYNNYVKKHGKTQADRFSARPGHSEHQTGLAFDFGGTSRTHWLESSFESTKEGKWLASNAHKYGFHLRYQKGKEHITGYMYEPWHFRYIGTDNATKIKATGKTLEEYFNVKGK